MVGNLRERLAVASSEPNLGEVREDISSGFLTVIFPIFTPDAVKSFWTRLIWDLSALHTVNGVLDVPCLFVDDDLAIIWTQEQPIICRSPSREMRIAPQQFQKPALPPAISLAIGGPSGVGKSTLIARLKQSSIGHRVKTYPAYTTRPAREHEVHGVDYYFVDPKELASYQQNPRFGVFVQARGYWVWADLATFFEARWHDERAVHVLIVTQVHEFMQWRAVVPDLQWVWLHAEDAEVRQRLMNRGDPQIEKSLDHNKRLAQEDRTQLVSLQLKSAHGNVDASVQQLIHFIESLEKRQASGAASNAARLWNA